MNGKVERIVSARFAAWIEKQAQHYAGKRCPRNFHQPKVPTLLKKQ